MTADYSQCHCGDRQQLLIYRYKQRPSHHAGAVIHLEGPHYHPDIPTGIRMHVILRGPRQRQKRRPQRPQSRGLGAAVCDSCLHSTCAPPASTQHNTRANMVAAGHYVIRHMLTCCETGKSTFFCTFCGLRKGDCACVNYLLPQGVCGVRASCLLKSHQPISVVMLYCSTCYCAQQTRS